MSVRPTIANTDQTPLTDESEISVFAVGKAESAFIWWITDLSLDDTNVITGWEIYRYRHYPGSDKQDDWLYKGKTLVAGFENRSCTVQSLHDGCLYRFSVRCLYAHGPPSVESKYSTSCFIEDALPKGWLRLYDQESNNFYYSNIRTKMSHWGKPGIWKKYTSMYIYIFLHAHIYICMCIYIYI
jgi:hypothetical protein